MKKVIIFGMMMLLCTMIASAAKFDVTIKPIQANSEILYMMDFPLLPNGIEVGIPINSMWDLTGKITYFSYEDNHDWGGILKYQFSCLELVGAMLWLIRRMPISMLLEVILLVF